MFRAFKNLKREKVGLALGGGAARGFAHVGVLKVLSKNNIPIDYISGTSAGSIVGALYAAKVPIATIEKVAMMLSGIEFVMPSFSFAGLNDSGVISNFLKPYLGNKTFKDLDIPLTVIVTDVKTGKEVIIDSGLVREAVQASSSYPVVYTPTEINGQIYIDGGFTNNLPISPVKKMGADFVIAVDVIPEVTLKKVPQDVVSIMNRAQDILLKRTHSLDSKDADIILYPITESVRAYDLRDQRKIITLGEKCAENMIQEIKRKLKKR
ncbi:MAG: patatin-like phospholipase family protein [Candidatus Margulisiibacteriota bacterium]